MKTTGTIRKEVYAKRLGLLAVVLFLGVFCAFASSPTQTSEWNALKKRLHTDGLEERYLERLFSHPGLVFDPRPMTAKAKEVLSLRSPQRGKTLEDLRGFYRAYEREQSLRDACDYLREHRPLLEKASRAYGVPAEIIVAIVLVESKLEKKLGNNPAFATLASMAVYKDVEDVRPYLGWEEMEAEAVELVNSTLKRRAEWAYRELKALLLYARANSLDPLAIKGSLYGAIGICQFMPSNIPLYGVDGNGDGRINLGERADAFTSIAAYLAKNGWKNSGTQREQQDAIYRYNHSLPYAEAIFSLHQRLRECSRLSP